MLKILVSEPSLSISFCLFLLNAAVVFLFTGASSLLITLNVINVIALFTLDLHDPISCDTDQYCEKSIEEVTAGNLGVTIPEFGNNCAGRLIPGINSLSGNIATLVREIRASSQTAMTLSDQLSARSAQLSVKTEQQSAFWCKPQPAWSRWLRAPKQC